MKKEKLVARIGLWSMFSFGVLTIVSVLIFPDKVNYLTPYEIWGFGIMCIIISLLFIQKEYRKPKKVKK